MIVRTFQRRRTRSAWRSSQTNPDPPCPSNELDNVYHRLTGGSIAIANLARAEMAAMLKAKNVGEAASYQYAQINAELDNRNAAFRWLAP